MIDRSEIDEKKIITTMCPRRPETTSHSTPNIPLLRSDIKYMFHKARRLRRESVSQAPQRPLYYSIFCWRPRFQIHRIRPVVAVVVGCSRPFSTPAIDAGFVSAQKLTSRRCSSIRRHLLAARSWCVWETWIEWQSTCSFRY